MLPLRVLVVDDNHDDLKIFGILLAAKGCEVRTCYSPCECVQAAIEFLPNLIVLDLAMPQTDGLKLAKELRALDLPDFLLVARTGYGDQKTRDASLDAGFDQILLKPIGQPGIDHLLDTARAFAGPAR